MVKRPAGGTLVAGVGNIFLGDDGFGVAVVERLRRETLAEQVVVADFGIRSLHLAYELLEGAFDTAILVDALQRGGAPGTIYMFEPEAAAEATPAGDAHGMTPGNVFALLASLGGQRPRRVLVVGCEPATTVEGIGLSDPVERSVDEAVQWILDLLPTEIERS